MVRVRRGRGAHRQCDFAGDPIRPSSFRRFCSSGGGWRLSKGDNNIRRCLLEIWLLSRRCATVLKTCEHQKLTLWTRTVGIGRPFSMARCLTSHLTWVVSRDASNRVAYIRQGSTADERLLGPFASAQILVPSTRSHVSSCSCSVPFSRLSLQEHENAWLAAEGETHGLNSLLGWVYVLEMTLKIFVSGWVGGWSVRPFATFSPRWVSSSQFLLQYARPARETLESSDVYHEEHLPASATSIISLS